MFVGKHAHVWIHVHAIMLHAPVYVRMQQPERLLCVFMCWLHTCVHACVRVYLCGISSGIHSAAAAEYTVLPSSATTAADVLTRLLPSVLDTLCS